MKNKRIIYYIFSMFILLSAVISTTAMYALTLQTNNAQTSTYFSPVIDLTIGSTTLNLDLNKIGTEENYELMEANTEYPMPIKYDGPDGISVSINGENVKNLDSITIPKIGKMDYLDVTISDGKIERKYMIRTLPMDFPDVHLVGRTNYEGDFYGDFASSSQNVNHYIFKLSTTGELKYYKGDVHVLRNFRMWDIDSTKYYTYFLEEKEFSNIATGGYCSGQYIVMDSNFNVIDKVSILNSENKNIGSEYPEQHEFVLLGPNHYITMAYVVRNPKSNHCYNDLTPGSRVIAAYLQEVKDNEIIWEWISTDYPEFYQGCVETDSFQNVEYMHAIDYFHLNSIYIDPKDNNIILSARSQDAIIKISRTDGHIIWILGGPNDQFGLSEDEKFSRQHFATYVDNGNLLLFDNGFESGVSRVIEMKLDEQNKTIEDYKTYSLGIFGQYCGSVQKMEADNDVYCIGWGSKVNSYSLMSLVDFQNAQVICELVGKSKDLWSYRICFY